jgi:hypothetical protein
LFKHHAPTFLTKVRIPPANHSGSDLAYDAIQYIDNKDIRYEHGISIQLWVMGFAKKRSPVDPGMCFTGERAGSIKALIQKQSKPGAWSHEQDLFTSGYYLAFSQLSSFLQAVSQQLGSGALAETSNYGAVCSKTDLSAPFSCRPNGAAEMAGIAPSWTPE